MTSAEKRRSTHGEKRLTFPNPMLVVVSGPSGVGKSTIVADLARAHPQVVPIVTATTRPRRPEEIDKVHYHFLAPEAFDDLGWTGEPFIAHRGAGCGSCGGTSYKGRVALYEVMPLSDEIREAILSGATALDLKRTAIQSGMKTLRQSGLTKVAEGVTTVEEIMRVTMAD